MGWDAISSAKQDFSKRKLKDPKIDRLFKNAEAYVKRKAGTVDGYLRIGGLNCSDCAYMLEKATGMNAWDDRDWSPEFVKEMYLRARWEFKYVQDEAWAYWSAKKFLEVCYKAKLTIKFSW